MFRTVFKEVTLFKVNPTELNDEGVPHDPSIRFCIRKRQGRGPTTKGRLPERAITSRRRRMGLKLSSCPSQSILHFYSCGFDQWYKKYSLLGAFPDFYFDRNMRRANPGWDFILPREISSPPTIKRARGNSTSERYC